MGEQGAGKYWPARKVIGKKIRALRHLQHRLQGGFPDQRLGRQRQLRHFPEAAGNGAVAA